MFKIVRFSSSFTNLWVRKPNAIQAIEVSTSGCVNVHDLTMLIKKENLFPFDSNQITLHQNLTDPPLEPNFPISSLSAAGLSAQVPLIVKSQEKNNLFIIMSSNISDSDKLSVLQDLMKVQSLAKDKEIQSKVEVIQSKDKEIQLMMEVIQSKIEVIQSKVEVIQSKDKVIQSMMEVIQLMKELRNEQVTRLSKEKEQETVYKLHYQQLLTISGLIELFEKNFGDKLLKKNLSRLEKWKIYLNNRNENFKPFKEAGFTVDEVSNHVDMIFKSHSADIHSIKVVEGLILKAKGNLTEDQMKVVKIIVEVSLWKDVVSIE